MLLSEITKTNYWIAEINSQIVVLSSEIAEPNFEITKIDYGIRVINSETAVLISDIN